MNELGYDIANPEPAGTIASLAALGYTVEAAVADLVDNSIAAGARRVDVAFTWAGRDSWTAVIDDGAGMSPAHLITAMTVAAGGTSKVRTVADLGRFGMGLKTASFSQARRVTVSTATTPGVWHTRTWDLDVVVRTGEWRLLHDAGTGDILGRLKAVHGRGTIVLWNGLGRYEAIKSAEDQATQQQFYNDAERVRVHLGMVFHRFVPERLRLAVNEEPVDPWDPFLSEHPATARLPVERIPLSGHAVRIEPFVLPHPKRLSGAEHEHAAGPRGWLDQQGYYVYRRDRLVLAGTWLGLPKLRRDEKYNLARISVDVPAELDIDWQVDVRKSSVVPPVALRPALRRIGLASREAATNLIRHRGQVTARAHGAEFAYAWQVRRNDNRVTLKINRQHPLVRQALRRGTEAGEDVRALIRLLEETVPVAALRVLHEPGTVDDPEPFAEAAPEEIVGVAERIFEAQVAQGRTPGEARERLRLMPPFDSFQGFWSKD